MATPPRPSQNLYEVLGVPPDVSTEALRQAFLARARTSHPDKRGGSEDEFRLVQTAYDILSDTPRRNLYDQFGSAYLLDPDKYDVATPFMSAASMSTSRTPDGVRTSSFFGVSVSAPGQSQSADVMRAHLDALHNHQAGQFASGLGTIPGFPRFSPNSAGSDSRRRGTTSPLGGGTGTNSDPLTPERPRSRPGRQYSEVSHFLPVELHEVILGARRQVPFEREVVCDTCGGLGALDKALLSNCVLCSGSGQRTVERVVMNMVQRLQLTCSACNGRGRRVEPGGECRACSGTSVVVEKVGLDVVIRVGAVDGERLLFPMMGHRPSPDYAVCGDVVLVLQVAVTDRTPVTGLHYTRLESSLACSISVSLFAALTGSPVRVELLDGRFINVSAGSTVIKPGEIRTVRGYGLPEGAGTGEPAGDLFVYFSVVFPDTPIEPAALTGILHSSLANDVQPEQSSDKAVIMEQLPTEQQAQVEILCRSLGTDLGDT